MGALMPRTGTSLRQEIDRLFDRFIEPGWLQMPALGDWEPKVDVSETKDAVVVRAEVPGVDQKDIGLSLQEGVLTIKGEKKFDTDVKDEQYHHTERRYGTFSRSFSLPQTVDSSRVAAEYKNGVLTVRLPLREEAKPRTIKVDVAA